MICRDWAKGFIEQNKSIAQQLAELKTEKISSTRKQTLEATLEDAPPLFKKTVLKHFDPARFETDEDFNAYLEEIKTDAEEAAQELSNKSLGSQSRPLRGSAGNDDKEASKEEVEAVVDQIM